MLGQGGKQGLRQAPTRGMHGTHLEACTSLAARPRLLVLRCANTSPPASLYIWLLTCPTSPGACDAPPAGMWHVAPTHVCSCPCTRSNLFLLMPLPFPRWSCSLRRSPPGLGSAAAAAAPWRVRAMAPPVAARGSARQVATAAPPRLSLVAGVDIRAVWVRVTALSSLRCLGCRGVGCWLPGRPARRERDLVPRGRASRLAVQAVALCGTKASNPRWCLLRSCLLAMRCCPAALNEDSGPTFRCLLRRHAARDVANL